MSPVGAADRLRRLPPVALTAVLAVGAAACGDDAGSPTPTVPPTTEAPLAAPAEADVVIDTFLFDPDPVEADAGSAVVFRNDDDILHTITQGTRDAPVAAGFDLQLDGAGSTGEVVVAGPGEIAYFCSIHAGMDGTLLVR